MTYIIIDIINNTVFYMMILPKEKPKYHKIFGLKRYIFQLYGTKEKKLRTFPCKTNHKFRL